MKPVDSPYRAILTKLRAARRRHGLSQAELGARVGLPQSHVAGIERGVDARLSTLLNIASALGLELMLVPRALQPAVHALVNEPVDRDRTTGAAADDPLSPYLVADEDGHEQDKDQDPAIRS